MRLQQRDLSEMERLQALYREDRGLWCHLYRELCRKERSTSAYRYTKKAHKRHKDGLFYDIRSADEWLCDQVCRYFSNKYYLGVETYTFRDSVTKPAFVGDGFPPPLYWQDLLDILIDLTGPDFEAYGQQRAQLCLEHLLTTRWQRRTVERQRNTLIFRGGVYWPALRDPLLRALSVELSGSVILLPEFQAEVNFYPQRDFYGWRDLVGPVERVKKYKNGRLDVVFDTEERAQKYVKILQTNAGI